MKFFYSGANNLDDAQTLSQKSLGGFRSSSIIPNGRVNSLFNDLSVLTVQDGVIETKCFFIKNTFDYDVKNVLLYALYPSNPQLDFKISAVSGNQVELLTTAQDIPYYSEFYDCKAVFAYTLLTVGTNFVSGETVKIEDVDVLVPDGLRATFMTNAVKAFETNSKYKAIQVDETTLKLEYRLLGVYSNSPSIVTTNVNVITGNAFAFGFDNSRLIAQVLKPGESIGVFLQRTPSGFMTQKTVEQYKAMFVEFRDNNYQPIQNQSLKSIDFCLEFSK